MKILKNLNDFKKSGDYIDVNIRRVQQFIDVSILPKTSCGENNMSIPRSIYLGIWPQ